MHPSEEKSQLRLAIKERLERYPKEKRSAESRSACRRALEILGDMPKTFCAYFPLKDELDTRSLLKDAMAKGHTLYLPRFHNGTLAFVRCDNLDELTPGGLKIPEPPEGASLLKPEDLEIAFIPARAYNRRGERCGRGNGGYDKWIRQHRAMNPETKMYGICFECQVVDRIPMEAHDETVDGILTARGLMTVDKM